MKTLNHDDEEPYGVLDAVIAGIEDVHRRQKLGGMPATEEDETKPPGYGTLMQTYEWRMYAPLLGREFVRAWCLTDGKWMTWTLKVDPRYGKTTNRHATKIDYNGRKVECWECRDCKQWVVK